jgi:hypothetical protein
MLINKLIHFIESHSQEIAKKWAKDILASEFMSGYQQFSETELVERSNEVYRNLGKWLDRDITSSDTKITYETLGQKRFKEKIPLYEVLLALHYTKKTLWNYIQSSGMIADEAFAIHQAMMLSERIYSFYDFAAFYISRGYHKAICEKLVKEQKVAKDQISEYFPGASADVEMGPEFY